MRKHGQRQDRHSELFRIEPGLKEALRTAAEQEHCSIANMVEVMIQEYFERVGVTIAEHDAPAKSRKATSRKK